MKRLAVGILAALGVLAPMHAAADVLAILINENSVHYEHSGANYDNSPANYDNSIANYDNSDANYDNSPANYDNSSANYENTISGNRRVIFTSGGQSTFLGYYVYSDSGVLNFYNASGNRVAFIPAGGHTKSLISGDSWCGHLGLNNGVPTVGLTETCYLRFLMDR